MNIFLVKFAWEPIYIFDIWKVLIGNIGITTVTLHFTLVYSFKCFVWNNLRKNEFYTLKLWYIRNDATFSESLCNVCMYIRVEINILCFCKKIWSGHFSRRRIGHTFFVTEQTLGSECRRSLPKIQDWGQVVRLLVVILGRFFRAEWVRASTSSRRVFADYFKPMHTDKFAFSQESRNRKIYNFVLSHSQ